MRRKAATWPARGAWWTLVAILAAAAVLALSSGPRLARAASSLALSATEAPADGTTTVTLTYTGDTNAQIGDTVRFTTNLGTFADGNNVFEAALVSDGTNLVATASLKSGTAGTANVTARNLDNPAISGDPATASVTFWGAPDAAISVLAIDADNSTTFVGDELNPANDPLEVSATTVPVRATFQDANGNPIVGATVTLTTAAGVWTENTQATLTATTDTNGQVQKNLTLPNSPIAPSTVSAEITTGLGNLTLNRQIKNTGALAAITLTTSRNSVGIDDPFYTGTGLHQATITVTVTDAAGNGVGGLDLNAAPYVTTLTPTGAGALGTFSAASTPGVYTITYTAGATPQDSVTITVFNDVDTDGQVDPGEVAGQVSLVQAGLPAAMTLTASPASVNAGSSATISAAVTDAAGRPVPAGLAVDFAVTGGNVLLPTTSATDNASGAAVTTFIAGSDAGQFTVIGTLQANPQVTGSTTVEVTASGGSFTTVANGVTAQVWQGTDNTDPATLPSAVTGVFQWNEATQTWDFWFRGFSGNTLTTLRQGGIYFFAANAAVNVPMN